MNEGCIIVLMRMFVVVSENIRRFELVWRFGNFRIIVRMRLFFVIVIGDKRLFVMYIFIKML